MAVSIVGGAVNGANNPPLVLLYGATEEQVKVERLDAEVWQLKIHGLGSSDDNPPVIVASGIRGDQTPFVSDIGQGYAKIVGANAFHFIIILGESR